MRRFNPDIFESSELYGKQRLKDLAEDESGQDIVEYALVAVMIVLGAVASLQSIATNVAIVFSNVGATFTGNV